MGTSRSTRPCRTADSSRCLRQLAPRRRKRRLKRPPRSRRRRMVAESSRRARQRLLCRVRRQQRHHGRRPQPPDGGLPSRCAALGHRGLEERLGPGAARSGQEGWGPNHEAGRREICSGAGKGTVVLTLAPCLGLHTPLPWVGNSRAAVSPLQLEIPFTPPVCENGWCNEEAGLGALCGAGGCSVNFLSAVFGAEVWLFPL